MRIDRNSKTGKAEAHDHQFITVGTSCVNHISLSADATLLSCSNSDGTCYVMQWDPNTATFQDYNKQFPSGSYGSTINCDNTLICTYAPYAHLTVYEIQTGNKILEIVSLPTSQDQDNDDEDENYSGNEAYRDYVYRVAKFSHLYPNLLCISFGKHVAMYNITRNSNKYEITVAKLMLPIISPALAQCMEDIALQQMYMQKINNVIAQNMYESCQKIYKGYYTSELCNTFTISSDHKYLCLGTTKRTLVYEFQPQYWVSKEQRNFTSHLLDQQKGKQNTNVVFKFA